MRPGPPTARQAAEAPRQAGTRPTKNSPQTVLAGTLPAVDGSPPLDMQTPPGAAREQAPEEEGIPPPNISPPMDPGTPNPRGVEPGRPAPASPVTAKAILEAKAKSGTGRPQPLTGGPTPAQATREPLAVAREPTPPVALGTVKARLLDEVAQDLSQGPEPGKLRAASAIGSQRTAKGTLVLATHKATQPQPLTRGGVTGPARVRPATARATPTSQ